MYTREVTLSSTVFKRMRHIYKIYLAVFNNCGQLSLLRTHAAEDGLSCSDDAISNAEICAKSLFLKMLMLKYDSF